MVAVRSFLLFFVYSASVSAVDECVKKGPCKCENSKGLLDLTPIANTNNTPRYKDLIVAPGNIYLYSWNPCYDFKEGKPGKSSDDQCQKVAACQSTQAVEFFNLGAQSSAVFLTDSNGVISVKYTHKLSSKSYIAVRTAYVQLICSNDTKGSVKALGEIPLRSGIYKLKYTGPHACMKKPQKSSHSLSTGSILCIIFFTVLIVYAIAGVLFQVFYRHASGVEVVPNVSFWTGCGDHIKEGCQFTCSKATSFRQK